MLICFHAGRMNLPAGQQPQGRAGQGRGPQNTASIPMWLPPLSPCLKPYEPHFLSCDSSSPLCAVRANLLPFAGLAHGSTELCLCAGGQTAPMAPLGFLPSSNDGSCSEQVPLLLEGLHLSGASISYSLLIYLFNLIELLETGLQ